MVSLKHHQTLLSRHLSIPLPKRLVVLEVVEKVVEAMLVEEKAMPRTREEVQLLPSTLLSDQVVSLLNITQ